MTRRLPRHSTAVAVTEKGPWKLARMVLHPLVIAMACVPLSAFADCTTVGTTTTCDTDAPNPWTTTVGSGSVQPAGSTATLAPGAQIVVGDANGISLSTNATITIGAGARVQNAAVNTTGQSAAFGNTIEFSSNSVLTVEAGAEVLATGTQLPGEAIGVFGSGNAITNRGLISAANAAAIWFEGPVIGTAANTVDNFGIIRTGMGTNATVIGIGGNKSIVFTNRSGARVEGSLLFATGNDTLTLEAGSVITGNFDGGGGTDTLNLSGALGSTDSLSGGIVGFETLNKGGDGTWTLGGALSGNLAINVDAGTLVLTGSNAAFTGSTTVDAGATLLGDTDALRTAITNNGTVVFAQDVAGTYSGVVSGTGALVKQGVGDLILTGANTYSGGTQFNAGALQAGSNDVLGAPAGALTFNGGTLRLGSSFDLAPERAIDVTLGSSGTIDTQAFNTTITQDIGGGGSLIKLGTGTLTLAGSTYVARTTISGGTVQLGNGGITGDLVGSSPITNNGTLAINRSDDAFIGSLISGTGGVNQIGSGGITLFANNTYTGVTNVNAGGLYINGNQTAATGATTVASDATLGGTGIIGGAVTLADGASLAPGDAGSAPGTLTINGSLTLAGGSTLNYSFGEANVPGGPLNDLINVGGDLTLDGTLNVDEPLGGIFGPGVYRVLNYSGALINNGLDLGTLPSADVFVQTSVANQVNLVNAAGLLLNYWDGAAGPVNDGNVNGGDGVWQASGNDSWTDATGSFNAPYADRSFAIFQGAAGTVAVDASLGAVTVAGMQFAADGYRIQGDPIVLAGSVDDPTRSILRVGDGTTGGAAYIATIDSALTGTSGLVKTDAGTLVLGGANDFSGGTFIEGGVLQVSSDANLGAVAGGLGIDTGTLRTTADITNARAITLGSGGGTLEQAGGTTLALDGVIVGAGALTKQGAGRLVLGADNTYAGGTTIAAGTLQLGSGGSAGSLVGNVTDNGTLAFNRSDAYTFAGVISGTGALQQVGAGTTVLTGENTYSGGTTIGAGTLQLGDGGGNGSLVGNVVDNGVLAVNRSNEVTFGGVISGSGALQQIGTGTTILSGENTYTGDTTISAGILQLGNGGTTGSLVGNVVNNDVLAVNRSNPVTLRGLISGTGALRQNGTGVTTLVADNTYTGGTTISAGTLQLGDGGANGRIVGDIANEGVLAFNRSDVVVFGNAVSGSGGLTQASSGTTVLTGANTLAGAHGVLAGTLAVGDAAHSSVVLSGGPTTVQSGGTLGGYGTVAGSVSNAGNIAVADAVGAFSGSGPGRFIIGGVLSNAGNVRLGGAGVGNRLIVGGYVGQGGQVVINTRLESDDSSSDRLVINGGSATGTSSLLVNNVGGAGALTPGNGILVVEPINGATTAAGAFALGQRVIAGPYEYSLFRGGRDGSSADAWFLRTEIDDRQTPEFRPEVSAYAALPSMAIGFGRATIGTLHERVGDSASQGSDDGGAAWGRVLGEGGDWNAKAGGIYADGPSFEQNFSALQIGADLFGTDRADGGRTQIGLYGIAGKGDGKVEHFDGSRAGTNKFDAYALGTYATWYGANAGYIDAVLQGTWYDAHAGSDEIGRLRTDGMGYSASLEAGQAFELANGWRIEPQAQVVYQRVRLDSGSDRVADVRFGDVESLAGRLGLRFAGSWETSAGRAIGTWFRGNVWHETDGDSKVKVSSENGFVPFRSSLKGSWYDISAGFSAKVADRVSLYANVGYEKAFDEGIEAVNGSLGVRMSW